MISCNRLSTLIVLIAVFVSACEPNGGGGGDHNPAIGPNLQGNWQGEYYVADSPTNSERLEITADISHNGDEITINTSKEGTGHSLKGRMDEDGNMSLSDDYDGETWTTFYGPATTNHLMLADYLVNYNAPSINRSPLAVIELRR